MSHAVQINYEQIAVQCHSICEVAENQVAELDRMLADLEGSSSRLLNDQTEALRRQIEKEKSELLKNINALKAQADKKTLATTTVRPHSECISLATAASFSPSV